MRDCRSHELQKFTTFPSDLIVEQEVGIPRTTKVEAAELPPPRSALSATLTRHFANSSVDSLDERKWIRRKWDGSKRVLMFTKEGRRKVLVFSEAFGYL